MPRARWGAGPGRPPDRPAPQAAIDLGRLCSNDPVCAQHAPENQHECRFLHGAACHGCLLIAETSCEQHNDFLDRALVVSTVDGNGAEFFGQGGIMTSALCLLTSEDLSQLAGALAPAGSPRHSPTRPAPLRSGGHGRARRRRASATSQPKEWNHGTWRIVSRCSVRTEGNARSPRT